MLVFFWGGANPEDGNKSLETFCCTYFAGNDHISPPEGRLESMMFGTSRLVGYGLLVPCRGSFSFLSTLSEDSGEYAANLTYVARKREDLFHRVKTQDTVKPCVNQILTYETLSRKRPNSLRGSDSSNIYLLRYGTVDGRNPEPRLYKNLANGINMDKLSTGGGFQPSTVW